MITVSYTPYVQSNHSRTPCICSINKEA